MPLRTLASGRNGAIGCDYSPSANAVFFVDFNRGEIVRVDLAAGTAQAIGGGYAFPEDIAVGPDGRAYVTERTGTLLRVDLANANRSAATVLHSGMTAPQQIAMSADGRRIYTVEYTQAAGGGSLWRVDLSGATPAAQRLVSGLREAVGILVSADERFALVNEQLGTGTVTRLTLASGARQQLVANVPAPFFMRWIDVRRTELFLPLRDPHNRIVRISLAPRAPAVANVLNVPFRPSSVVVTRGARIVVCCDAVVEEHQLATDSAARILGIVYDPPGPDLIAERIVLQNRGANYVDLTGWTIRDAANHVYSFASGLHIPPGDVLRLWTKTGTDGDGDVYWNRGMAVWNNTPGDVARLRDGQGTDVDTRAYSTPSVKTTPGPGTTVGPGGGGAMYSPLVSPHDASLLYACCDMGGLYRSTNSGGAWTLLDGREMFVNTSIDRGAPPRLLPPRPLAPHPDPAKIDWLVAWSELRGLRLSRDRGATWTDVPTGTSGGTPWPSRQVTALGIDPANGRLFVGTQNGAHYHDADAAGAWAGTGWTTCAAQSGGAVTGAVVAFVLLPGGGSASHMLATRGDATRDGEAMRSADGGATWTNVSAGLPQTLGGRRRINDFAGGFNATLHPTAVVYATVPSDAAGTTGGIYSWDAAGGTWTRVVSGGLPATAGSGAVQYECLGVSANNPNLVYVSGFAANAGWRESAGIFRSPDRGSMWQSVWPGPPPTGGWLEFDRPGFGGPPLGLSVRQHAPGSGVVTAVWTNKGSLLAASDSLSGAPTWQAKYTTGANPAPKQAWSSAGLEVTTVWHYDEDPFDTMRRYLSYTDIGFLRSTDGGSTWRNDSTFAAWRSNFYQLAFDPTTAGRLWAAASDQHDLPYEKELGLTPGSGGILWSSDQGGNWAFRNAGLPNAPAVSVVLDPRSPAAGRQLWASVFKHGVYRTDDGGASWHLSSIGLPQTPHAYRLHLHADGTLFCALTGTGARDAQGTYLKESALFRSFDQGGSWQRVSDLLEYVVDYAVHPVDSRVVYLCTTGVRGADGAVRATVDGGRTWTKVLGLQNVLSQPPTDRFHAFGAWLHPQDTNVVVVATNTHGAWLSKDGGASWARFGGVPFTRVHRFTLERQNALRMFVATHGAGAWLVPLS